MCVCCACVCVCVYVCTLCMCVHACIYVKFYVCIRQMCVVFNWFKLDSPAVEVEWWSAHLCLVLQAPPTHTPLLARQKQRRIWWYNRTLCMDALCTNMFGLISEVVLVLECPLRGTPLYKLTSFPGHCFSSLGMGIQPWNGLLCICMLLCPFGTIHIVSSLNIYPF